MVDHVQDLQHPESMYRALGTKLVVGMPFKDIATSDSIFLRELPPQSDAQGQRALRRLQVSTFLPLSSSSSDILKGADSERSYLQSCTVLGCKRCIQLMLSGFELYT